jgi:hypothetical protein
LQGGKGKKKVTWEGGNGDWVIGDWNREQMRILMKKIFFAVLASWRDMAVKHLYKLVIRMTFD